MTSDPLYHGPLRFRLSESAPSTPHDSLTEATETEKTNVDPTNALTICMDSRLDWMDHLLDLVGKMRAEALRRDLKSKESVGETDNDYEIVICGKKSDKDDKDDKDDWSKASENDSHDEERGRSRDVETFDDYPVEFVEEPSINEKDIVLPKNGNTVYPQKNIPSPYIHGHPISSSSPHPEEHLIDPSPSVADIDARSAANWQARVARMNSGGCMNSIKTWFCAKVSPLGGGWARSKNTLNRKPGPRRVARVDSEPFVIVPPAADRTPERVDSLPTGSRREKWVVPPSVAISSNARGSDRGRLTKS